MPHICSVVYIFLTLFMYISAEKESKSFDKKNLPPPVVALPMPSAVSGFH